MEKTYTVFGDSITRGMKIENGKPMLLETNAINILENKYNIKINNISCFGQTLKRAYTKGLFDEYIQNLDQEKQNIAIIELGSNDADFDWKTVAENFDKPNSPKTTEAEFENLLNETIQKLKKANVEVWITTLLPVCSVKYFEKIISNVANAENILKFFRNDLTVISRHQDVFNLIKIKCAYKNNIKLLDIRSEFMREIDIFSKYEEDGSHPNIEGQKFLAEKIEKLLAK